VTDKQMKLMVLDAERAAQQAKAETPYAVQVDRSAEIGAAAVRVSELRNKVWLMM